MTDYIEREAALRIAHGFCHPANIGDEIAKLPSADVAPVVRGRWSEMDKGHYVCSACNAFITINYGYKYCPNCGAKMEGEDG